jgi:hypothetical protein
MTCILLADGAGAREEEHRRAVRARGLKRSSTFRSYTHSEPRFRVLLAEGDVRALFHGEASERLDDACFTVEVM